MAGAITYAASRSIDEITAGSIPVSRGGSIPVSAKEQAGVQFVADAVPAKLALVAG